LALSFDTTYRTIGELHYRITLYELFTQIRIYSITLLLKYAFTSL